MMKSMISSRRNETGRPEFYNLEDLILELKRLISSMQRLQSYLESMITNTLEQLKISHELGKSYNGLFRQYQRGISNSYINKSILSISEKRITKHSKRFKKSGKTDNSKNM